MPSAKGGRGGNYALYIRDQADLRQHKPPGKKARRGGAPVRKIAFFSQNEVSCGADVETACGPVSLANALLLHSSTSMPPPSLYTHISLTEVLRLASTPPLLKLSERLGISGDELCALGNLVATPYGLQAEFIQHCTLSQLNPGDLIYVGSIPLKNAQGGVQFEEADYDSHVVMVEATQPDAVVVINPDCRRSGRGFMHNNYGRMVLPASSLDKVWMTTRADGTRTCKAAVLFTKCATKH
jgi:hypothetical protein